PVFVDDGEPSGSGIVAWHCHDEWRSGEGTLIAPWARAPFAQAPPEIRRRGEVGNLVQRLYRNEVAGESDTVRQCSVVLELEVDLLVLLQESCVLRDDGGRLYVEKDGEGDDSIVYRQPRQLLLQDDGVGIPSVIHD